MSKKKDRKSKNPNPHNAYIEGSGIIEEKNIVETLEENYMPYAMSVIVSRALPEIDGFKPSHRKLLYTMYKMGLLNSARTKSANIVGQTMRLNPHGDGPIYETMVRLARGNESLLHPYVDSKGNFGKAYSRDMAYAASRYTEAKLESICNELFSEIDFDTVDMVPNYDNSTKEPLLLPAKFPSILVNSNFGLAVSMASSICSFNLKEVCETTIALIKDPQHNALTTLKGPDFSGGGEIVYDEKELEKIYTTGRGSVKVRGKYIYDQSENCIEITEIPPTTTVEAIIDKVVDLVKENKIKEIADVRDETDLSGLKLVLDLKRNVDYKQLMAKIFRFTPLEDNFSANFNILIAGTPRVMGVYKILDEWTHFRVECIRRKLYFQLGKKREKLHLLMGLQKILLDIDKAIKIIRETEEEADVVPNLMIGFGIDEIQAEYVAEIKLRHINKEYIVKRIAEIESLNKDIAEMELTISEDGRIKSIIIDELREISKKYGQSRKTTFTFEEDEVVVIEEEVPDYPVHIFMSEEGYFKKITPQSLRMSKENKLKEGDRFIFETEATNKHELLFFTDKFQVYKSRCSDFDDTKAANLGEYIPARLGFDEGERLIFTCVTLDYSENLVIFFKNGKCAKVPLASYETKTKRKKLAKAFSHVSEVVAMFTVSKECEFILKSAAGKVMIFSTELVLPKTTKTTQGVQVMRLTKTELASARRFEEGMIENADDFRTKNIPVAGTLSKIDIDQLELE